jgi:DNA-binding IclR family transcriptional regulator
MAMVKSVNKAIDILFLFTADRPRLSLSEISRSLGIPKSTAHNLLATLVSRGVVEQVENEAYALGKMLVVLSQAVNVNVEFRDRAAPLLRQMADRCHESVYLTVKDGDVALYIYAIESPRRLLARTAIGERVPLHCTSNGKAILAQLSSNEVSGISRRTNLPAYTKNTLTTLPDLLDDLEVTRNRGFSIDNQEHEINTYCIGAPIFNGQGHVVGGCSISGADPEIIRSRQLELANLVQYTAQEISRRMGYVLPTPSKIVELA